MTATLSANNMDTSILVLSGFIKIISKRGAKGYFKVASIILKLGQRQLFQSGSMFISKSRSYFKVGQRLFLSGAVTSKWGRYFTII